MRFIQIKLLLWKNAILIKRKPWITLVQMLLPLVLFLILLIVRLKLPPVNISDKYYYAKPMPSAGYVPFIQSLLCDPISGRPEIRLEHVSPYKKYTGASIYPMISLVDATVQLTDTYSTLTEFHTKLLRDLFNITDTDDVEDIKDSISRAWDSGVSTVLDDSASEEAAVEADDPVGDVVGDFVDNHVMQMMSLDHFMKRDLSSFITPAYGDDVAVEPPEDDDFIPLPTNEPLINLIKEKMPVLLDPMSAQETARRIMNGHLDKEARDKTEESMGIMTKEYLKHKYLEKTGEDDKEDLYDHSVKLQQLICNEGSLKSDPQVQYACRILRERGRMSMEAVDMDMLSIEVLSASQRISESTKMIKLDLQALQRSNKTKYIQGMFCGRDPQTISSSDEASRTLDVKLKLLSDFKHAKLTYTPDTLPVREIIHRMNETFERAVMLRNFSLNWEESAPRLKRCIVNMGEASTLQEVMERVTDCYKEDQRILPAELRPWFNKFTRQQNALHKILKVVEAFDKTANYTSLLQLHPVLQTQLSPKQLQLDIDMITENLQLFVKHTDDIDFDVFVPFNNSQQMAQWIKTSDAVVWAGIDFTNVNEVLPAHVEYTLRMNAKVKVGTGDVMERFWSPSPNNGFSHRRYEWSGFCFLQDIIDRAIIAEQAGKSGYEDPDPLPASYIQEIPYPCHCWDAFLKNSVIVLPMALCLSFIYSVCVIVRNVVHEKEARIKEAMQQMGLSNSVHWCSWYITSMLQMSFTSTMLVFMLHFGNITRHSNPGLLWLFLHAGSLATVSFCFLLSVFFSEAKLAAAGSGLAYIVMYLPYTCISQSDGSASHLGKAVVSLFSTSAFGMGMEYIIRLEEQGVGLQGHTLTQGVFPTDEYNMLKCFFALIGDAVIYFLLALYIEGVFPGRYGVPKPWYFPFQFLFWCRHPSPKGKIDNTFELPGHTADVERPPDQLTCGIAVTNLSKKYKGMDQLALSGLTIDLYENQILTLLGHNGAGKTTTMSILSGLYPPTSGTAVVYGKDIRKDMRLIRQDLGVCPQFNVLFEHLTVEEHLWFFSSLKGTPSTKVREEVDRFIKSVGLADKADSLSKELSGGMKRKLCVAMAFVGNSRIVILDEPTAGVDPWSRRSIWEMVLKHKQERTILLSTHHMDEADLLGDRVAILSHGKLLCCGSPLYLKSRFGPGYYLNIEKSTGIASVPDLLDDSGFIASDSLDINLPVVTNNLITTDVNMLDKEKMPSEKTPSEKTPSEKSSSEKHKLPGIFNQIETSKLIQSYVQRATIHYQNELEISYLLPWEAFQRGVFPDLFKSLDQNLADLGIRCYGVMDSTLEEVFLSVADGENMNSKKTDTLLGGDDMPLDEPDENYASNEIPADLLDNEKVDEELADLLPLSKQDIPPPTNCRQIRAQLLKRIHHTRRDCWGLFFQLVLPAVFVSLAMIISIVRPHLDSSQKLELSVDMFKHPYYVPFSDNSSSGTSRLSELVGYPAGPWAPPVDAEVMALNNFTKPKHTSQMDFPWQHYYNSPKDTCGNHVYPEIPNLLEFKSITGYVLQNLTGWNVEKFLVQTNMKYVFQRYGAITVGESHNDLKRFSPKNWTSSNLLGWGIYNPYTAKAWHSYRGMHALPTYLSAVNNLVLRSALPKEWGNLSEYGITVSTHPLSSNGSLADTWELMDEETYDLVISVFIIVALSFVPASFVLFLVSERCSSLYLLECIAGARIFPYWISNLIWDLVSFTVANAGCLLVIVAFRSPSFSSAENIPAITMLLMLYSWSITPLMYIFSKIFAEANNAYVIMICLNTFCGITTTLTTFLIEFLAPNDIGFISFNNILKYLFLLLPNYCLGRGVMDLAANQFINDIKLVYGYPTVSPWSWNVIGRNLAFMGATGFVFLAILCLMSIPRKGKRKNVPNYHKDVEDEDVKAERQRTIYSYAYNDILKTQNLCKVYKKNKVVVNRLAFSVSPGECFGLLGINGAGKTTTFKMLTGEIAPSNGDAVVTQISLIHQISAARTQMGYCPQTDALLPTLTSYETLALFARLRGIPESQIDYISRQIIRTVGLSRWASRPCGTYSGGNKRKLSAAITLIGEPRLILLDEPTAGMDPGARRSLWSVIQAQKNKGKAIVITSHSMAECEVLCSRIGIMVAGRLRCLGSAQHLRDKYGNGYVIRLKLNPQEYNLNKVKAYMAQHLPGAVIKEENYCSLKYEVKQKKSQVSDIFTVLQKAKPDLSLLDYAVHQTNLEQVFINFAQAVAPKEVDDELLCLEENVVPNLQLSFD